MKIQIDGEAMTLGELVDRVDTSTHERPAPYLRNHILSDWPAELGADVSPMPVSTRANWVDSRLFPAGKKLSSVEFYIGGIGAKFPVLHYDFLQTHAFLMQLYGEKEYVARILITSVTVSLDVVNRANAAAFRRDYVERMARRSRMLGWVAGAALVIAETTLLFERR